MATTTFDTLEFANALKAAGVPEKQAEAQARVLADALAVNFSELATKDDLKTVVAEAEQRLNARMESVEQRLSAKIDNQAARFDGQISLLKWMTGVSMTVGVGVLIRLLLGRVS